MWEKLREFFEDDWSTRERVMVTVLAALVGLVVGLRFAPRRSVEFGTNNHTHYHALEEMEEA